MSRIETVDIEDLEAHLGGATSKAATERLMVAIAHKRGVSVDDLADWYDLDRETLDEWFGEFESRPVGEVVEEIERFELPGRSVTPWTNQPRLARVEFLNYEVLDDHGWSVDDDDLFEKAHDADLDTEDHGRIAVESGESILEAAENRGFSWPFACRGGACSNCAVILYEGEIAMPGNQILPDEAVERGARLVCVGAPTTDEVKLIYNAKHLDYLDELRLPPHMFEETASH